MTRNLRRSGTRVRLAAEPLECREGPSSLIDPLASSILSPIWAKLSIAFNQAPRIADFKAIVGANGEVTFTGRVLDDQAVAGTFVRIKGTGIELSAIVGSDGRFSVSTAVQHTGELTVTATVLDVFGAASAPAFATFDPSVAGGTGGASSTDDAIGDLAGDGIPVVVEAKAVNGSGGAVNVAGTAADDKSLAGCVVKVTADGVSESGVVESTGKFSVAFTRLSSADFVVKVTVTDSDGNVSAPVYVLVSGA